MAWPERTNIMSLPNEILIMIAECVSELKLDLTSVLCELCLNLEIERVGLSLPRLCRANGRLRDVSLPVFLKKTRWAIKFGNIRSEVGFYFCPVVDDVYVLVRTRNVPWLEMGMNLHSVSIMRNDLAALIWLIRRPLYDKASNENISRPIYVTRFNLSKVLLDLKLDARHGIRRFYSSSALEDHQLGALVSTKELVVIVNGRERALPNESYAQQIHVPDMNRFYYTLPWWSIHIYWNSIVVRMPSLKNIRIVRAPLLGHHNSILLHGSCGEEAMSAFGLHASLQGAACVEIENFYRNHLETDDRVVEAVVGDLIKSYSSMSLWTRWALGIDQ